MSVLLVIAHFGAILAAARFGYVMGLNKGHRIGLRNAVRICVESEKDPRDGFREWLKTAGEA